MANLIFKRNTHKMKMLQDQSVRKNILQYLLTNVLTHNNHFAHTRILTMSVSSDQQNEKVEHKTYRLSPLQAFIMYTDRNVHKKI